MKRLLALLMVLTLYQAPFSCNDKQVYAGLDGTSNYPAALDTSATTYMDVETGDTVEAAHHDIQSDGIIKLQTKLGIGSYTPLANTALTCVTAGRSYWGEITPFMLFDNSAILPTAAETGYCFTMNWNGGTPYFELTSCGAGGSGDEILINANGVSPSATFTDGDIAWSFTDGGAGSDVVKATVACTGCIDITDIGADAVGSSEIVDDSVANADMADNAIGNAEMADDAIGVAELDDGTDTAVANYNVVIDPLDTTQFAYIDPGTVSQPLDGTLTDIADGTLSGEVLSIAGASSGLTIGAVGSAGDLNLRNGATSAGYIDFYEDATNGNNVLRLIAYESMADWTLILPEADGTVGQLLKTDGSGALGWVDAGAAAAGGADTNIQYSNSGVLAGLASLVYDATAGYPKVIDDNYLLFGSDDDWYMGYDATNALANIYTNAGASANTDYGMVTIAIDADNSGVTTNQELFEIGYGGSDDSSVNWVERFALDKEGDLVIGGTFTPAGLINSAATGSTIKVSGTGSTWSLADSISVASITSTAGVAGTDLDDTATPGGASLIGVYNDAAWTNIDCDDVQECIADIDAAITGGGGGYADYIYEGDTYVETVDTGIGYIKMYTDGDTTVATSGQVRLPANDQIAWYGAGSDSYISGTTGYLTLYPGSAAGKVYIGTGNLQVGTGTPGTAAMDGDDAYIKGQLEVDGAAQFDSTADFNNTANFYQITMDASTTPATYFNDSDYTGVQEGKILVNCTADDNCDMDFGVHSGADTPTTVMKFDTDAGETLIQIGTPGTNYVQVTEAGAMSFVGTASLTGELAGNASTATALAANGANCTAGQSPLGVDASGAVESCFDVATQTELDNFVGSANITTLGTITTGVWTGTDIVDADIADDLTITSTKALSATSGTFTGELTGNLDVNVDADGALLIPATDCRGSLFVNTTQANTYELPAAAAGLNCCFLATSAHKVTVEPLVLGDDHIVYAGTALAEDAELDSPATIGAYACFVAIDNTTWYVLGSSGTWVDD